MQQIALDNPSNVRRRFATKFRVEPNGCHTWTAFVSDNGYGRIAANGTTWYAHRAAYCLANGSIPPGLELDHLCRNRACVNPDHLEPVTKLENQLRSPISIIADQVARTSCPRGHSDYGVRRDGKRYCKPCQKIQTRKTNERRRTERLALAEAS